MLRVLVAGCVSFMLMYFLSMSWHEKAHTLPFDNRDIHGLHYLDGDVMARTMGIPYLAGQKYPVIEFPSGYLADAWEVRNETLGAVVHLFGEMDLPYFVSRDDAFDLASDIAAVVGYRVKKRGQDELELSGHDVDEHLLIRFDTEGGRMADVLHIEATVDESPQHPGHDLMPDELREQLPELYETEELGDQAPGVVKYFTPDGQWTWYASEFDGEDIFYGLVIGFEIELGYFSLSELRQVRGPLNLPIERDLYYEPESLTELREKHRKMRRGDE